MTPVRFARIAEQKVTSISVYNKNTHDINVIIMGGKPHPDSVLPYENNESARNGDPSD